MAPQVTDTDNRRQFSSFTVNIIFIILALAGLAFIPLLTIKLNPGSVANSLTVGYSWPDAVPGVMEHEVTAKLEGAFSTLRGIENVSSYSSKGYGSITLETKKNTNLQTLRFEVLSIIKDLWQHLPEGVAYPVISGGREGNGGPELLLSYTMKGNAGISQLKLYAEKTLIPKYTSIKGINSVKVFGADTYEWQLYYDVDKLNIYGISPYELSQALQLADEARGVGQSQISGVKGDRIIIPVVVDNPGLSANSENWKNISVGNHNGKIIFLGDLVTRSIVQQLPQSYFRINGLNTVNVNIYSEATANQISVADQIALVDAQITSSLPKGYSLEKSYDSTDFLRKELDKTSRRSLAALVILLVFILIVTLSLRYLLIITLSLIANLLIACIFYYFLHVEIHLVSIAGITVSLSIIIDNYIMMTNYLVQQRSMRGFTAVLGSTLTTLGALVVIFFLNENERGNLIDFAMVVIINLTVSLAVALFFIPALLTRLKVSNRKGKAYRKQKRWVSRFNRWYALYIVKVRKWRWAMVLLAIFGFGIPFYLLPDEIRSETTAAKIYNVTLGSNFIKGIIRPYLDKFAGGTLRLFAQSSLGNSYRSQKVQETVLNMGISLPKGTTILQMNELCVKLEKYLATLKGIHQFQTSIYGPQYASITVYFTKEAQKSSIPYIVKARMVAKAVEYNGADFDVSVKNDQFSNALRESWRSSRIILSGYNYRELIHMAQITKDTLAFNPRIQNIVIYSGDLGGQPPVTEQQRSLEIDKSLLAVTNSSYFQLLNELSSRTVTSQGGSTIKQNGEYIPVRFISDQSASNDMWKLMNTPIKMGDSHVKLANTATTSTVMTDGSIYKKNQSYIVSVAYDFIGADELSRRILEREVIKLNDNLPLGYKAALPEYNYNWMNDEKSANYWLIGLVILIIWGICAIIFESLTQPFAVICSIPLSFIGVFLTFYLFGITFDQGGYAAFILLSGIVVNMSIYIFNDINHLRRNTMLSPMAVYMKAFNIKIVPILLTSTATILGLLPFVIFDRGAPFWYALATGTIGGLVFSIPMLILYLPLMVKMTTKAEDMKQNDKLINTI